MTTSYGAWSSPIRAADVADGVSLAFPQLVPVDGSAPEVWWTTAVWAGPAPAMSRQWQRHHR